MQTLIDQHGSFALPTGWHEVSTRQFCEADPLTTVEQRASYFAGRPIQVNGLVADALKWMLQPPPTDGGLPYPLDLGQETYLQVETIRALLSSQPLHQCFGEVYGLFVARYRKHGRDPFNQTEAAEIGVMAMDWRILATYPAVAHCLAELTHLAAKYAELAEPDPTEAGRRARDAGADELLGVFGHFNVAKALAEREGCSIDVIYQRPYETIAITLLHDRRTAILSDTIQRNAKTHE
jgi:hypothetical protein